MPSNLAEVNLSELRSMASASSFPVVFRAVWSSDRADFAHRPSAGEHLVPAHELFTKDNIAQAIRRRSAQFPISGQIAVRTKRKLHAHRYFAQMGAARRIRLHGPSGVLPLEVVRYVKGPAHANLLKQVKGPLPGMASAFR